MHAETNVTGIDCYTHFLGTPACMLKWLKRFKRLKWLKVKAGTPAIMFSMCSCVCNCSCQSRNAVKRCAQHSFLRIHIL